MSSAKRVISGSLASWMRIGITMISQLILVPVYLTYWDVTTYGIWIAIQALVSIISVMDQGHQTFLEFEFLKDGRDNRKSIAYNFWSSMWVGAVIGAAEILLVLGFIFFGLIGKLLGAATANPELIHQAEIVLILQMIVWAVLVSPCGLFVRVLSPFGYYARMSWWGVLAAVATSFIPLIAVIFGADLLQAGISFGAATIAYSIPQFIDIFRLIKKEGLKYRNFSFEKGKRNFLLSLALSGKSLLENSRQQGVRVILAPLSGATALVAFSTIRTGANIVLQGLNTITNPLMPELMRFLNEKDQQRMEASFSTVWIVVLLILSPGVILLQVFAGPLFVIWTKGQIHFDPLLFLLLSMGVLVYAVAQPAMAVIRGNNILRPQLIIAAMAGTIVVGGMFVLVPVYGILGAGICLLIAEVAATASYRVIAKKWLSKNGLQWPEKMSRAALLSVWGAGSVMLAMIYLDQYKWILLLTGFLILGIAFYFFRQTLPPLVLNKVKSVGMRLLFFKKSYQKK